MNRQFSFTLTFMAICLPAFNCFGAHGTSERTQRPNILWILAEDLSPFFGCYNDPINTGHTPTIDKLASEGVIFKRAFVPAPVCSACRSALITGVMQTTTGTHQHRSSRFTDGEIVPEDLRIHLPDGMKTIPELMKEAGYFTYNDGKDDYNFHYDRTAFYDVGSAEDYKPGQNGWQGNKGKNFKSISEKTWRECPDKSKPWFGQIQICLLYTSPSPRDGLLSRMPSSA